MEENIPDKGKSRVDDSGGRMSSNLKPGSRADAFLLQPPPTQYAPIRYLFSYASLVPDFQCLDSDVAFEPPMCSVPANTVDTK